MMKTEAIHIGYVLTDDGTILVQTPDDSQWGFALHDDEQSWPGGFGVASGWEPLAADDPRITAEDRERLQWILDWREPPFADNPRITDAVREQFQRILNERVWEA